MLVKIGKYIGFCVYRRSYLLWSPVIGDRRERGPPTDFALGDRRAKRPPTAFALRDRRAGGAPT